MGGSELLMCFSIIMAFALVLITAKWDGCERD